MSQRTGMEADEFHKKYLESLYKKFALMDLIESEQASTVKTDLSNLLKKKYDLPIIRAKTINVIDGPIFSDLNTTLKEALSEFNSKTGRRKHMADRANVRYIVRSNNRLQISATEGFFLGFVRKNRKQIIEAFINKYKLDSLRLRIHKSKEEREAKKN
jgi:sulfite reductase alpha subunit-like flavoprotein